MISRMKMRAISLLMFCLGAVLCCFGQTANPEQAPSEYAQLLAQVKSGDVKIDFKRLRLAYAASPERRHAKDTQEERNASSQAMLQEQFEKVLQLVDVVLANDYTCIPAHILAARANFKLGNEDKASFHQAVVTGLLSSIMENRQPRDKKNAWIVISEMEEKVVPALLELQVVHQSTVQEDGHRYEIVETVNPKTQAKSTIYFNTDLVEN
jgi:Domain of unknown function (DUF4919)